MRNYEIIITICNCLSLLASVTIFTLFCYYLKLRKGFFSRIVSYLTVGNLCLITGIQMSNPTYPIMCQYSVSLIIYGSLSMLLWNILMMWCIKYIFSYDRDAINDIEMRLDQLHIRENRMIFCCFFFPLLMAFWPLWANADMTDQYTNFCYLYTSKEVSIAKIISTDIEKLIIWELPIAIYLGYSSFVLRGIRQVFDQNQDNLQLQVSKVVKQLLAFPIVTLIATIQFTILDIQSFFTLEINYYQSTLSICFLSLWGVFNGIAYLVQSSVQEEIKRKNSNEPMLNLMQSSQLSRDSSDLFYFYKDDVNLDNYQIRI